MVEINIVNFITVGVIALIFAWLYNTYLKQFVSKATNAVTA